MSLTKKDIKEIEKSTISLINIDNVIWEKHGWESHEDIDMVEYYRELKDALTKKGVGKIRGVIYHILENINYHDLNKALGYFGKKGYYEASNEDYDLYRKLGGRSFI